MQTSYQRNGEYTMKSYIIAINPNMIYFTIDANNKKEAIEQGIEEIDQYFVQNSVKKEDLTIKEIK